MATKAVEWTKGEDAILLSKKAKGEILKSKTIARLLIVKTCMDVNNKWTQMKWVSLIILK